MNVPLLLEIKARILADPDAFRMDTWSCGTAHCIAGWALALSGLKIVNPDEYPGSQRLADGRYPGRVAEEILGLSEYANHLFDVDCWPETFADRYNNEASRADLAQIAADRIDHFIATNGAE